MSVNKLAQATPAAPFAGGDELIALGTVAILIAVGGLVGGYAAYLAEERGSSEPANSSGSRTLRFLVLGLVASACVPLFLSLVRSDILSEIFTDANNKRLESCLVFVGLCLIAAFSARSFIDSISQRILQQVKHAEARAEKADQKAEQADQKAEKADQKAEKADQKAEKAQETTLETALEVADEGSAEPSPELNHHKGVAVLENMPALEDVERRTLHALTKMTFRTATGIAADTGVSRSQISEALDSLKAKGLAETAVSPKTGGVRWKITSHGIGAI